MDGYITGHRWLTLEFPNWRRESSVTHTWMSHRAACATGDSCMSIPRSGVCHRCLMYKYPIERRRFRCRTKPAGVFSPQLSRILPQKGAVSLPPAWLKKFEPTVTQNPMTIGRFFIIVIEKYPGKESDSKRCVPIFRSYSLKDKLT
ncbi:hypothetical protein AVEN_241295-1 [Araneus ventricosus]|uniref:Uncharacterized protein n=1 Tax=Araneus ventricosus TaxID=182803 RepID=A0A4Y2C1R9_ARAVE|nr:hypothetical protein AVEN_241295-1 [Araneus ventricosus]